MIEFSEGYSRGFTKIINILLDEIYSYFMEIGSNLDYEEIYSIVFPEHKQDDQISGMSDLKTLHRYIRDNFHHTLTPLYEYILYNVLYFVYESSEDEFNLEDIRSNLLTTGILSKSDDEEALKLLESINNPNDVIGIIFEDIDFLEVEKLVEIYRKQPEILSEFLHIDLDFYQELMPEDIKLEYNLIKDRITDRPAKIDASENNHFNEVIIRMVQDFKHIIEHKKGYTFLNTSGNKANEKVVQRFFYIIANVYLKDTNILMNPEVDLGRGCIDVYFSIGKKYRALVELKLGTHQRYKDGIDYQLPTYLKVEGVSFGIFVLICYSKHEFDSSRKLFENAKELSLEYEKDIRFERIDASGTLKSASKIKNKAEMGFEE